MCGMHRTHFDHARLDLLLLVIWSRVFWPTVTRTWNLRKAQRWSNSVLTFRSLLPALRNLWLVLVSQGLIVTEYHSEHLVQRLLLLLWSFISYSKRWYWSSGRKLFSRSSQWPQTDSTFRRILAVPSSAHFCNVESCTLIPRHSRWRYKLPEMAMEPRAPINMFHTLAICILSSQ